MQSIIVIECNIHKVVRVTCVKGKVIHSTRVRENSRDEDTCEGFWDVSRSLSETKNVGIGGDENLSKEKK